MSLTTFGRNVALRGQFGADRGAAAPAILYFALFNGDAQATGVEPTSVGGYARIAKNNDATLWGTIGLGIVTLSNADEILWPTTTDFWSQTTVTHWAIFDNSSTGNMVVAGKLNSPVTLTGAGDIVRIPAGGLTVTQAAG